MDALPGQERCEKCWEQEAARIWRWTLRLLRDERRDQLKARRDWRLDQGDRDQCEFVVGSWRETKP